MDAEIFEVQKRLFVMIGLPLLWILSVFFAGSIRRRKGRTWGSGALLGLLFGPLGVIAASAFPVQVAITESAVATETTSADPDWLIVGLVTVLIGLLAGLALWLLVIR